MTACSILSLFSMPITIIKYLTRGEMLKKEVMKPLDSLLGKLLILMENISTFPSRLLRLLEFIKSKQFSASLLEIYPSLKHCTYHFNLMAATAMPEAMLVFYI